MFLKNKLGYGLGMLFLTSLSITNIQAVTITQTGTFTTDDQIFQFLFNVPTAQTLLISTTSYGGGVNLNGTTTVAGGFVPVVSLFSATGAIIGSDGADGMIGGCRAGARMDSVTGMCDDAYLLTTVAAGNYTLTLTEFPNVPIGNLSDGFLFTGSPNITGNLCGSASGKFLQADVSPCVQRTGNFAANINTVPEPSTIWLAVPALAATLMFRRRVFSPVKHF